jgi:hypothetical protein
MLASFAVDGIDPSARIRSADRPSRPRPSGRASGQRVARRGLQRAEAAGEEGADAAARARGIRHPLAGGCDLGEAFGDHATPFEVAEHLLLGEPGQFE